VTHIAGKDDIPRGLGCRFVNRKAETDRRKNSETRTTDFRSGFRIRARGHYDRAKPIIRSRPYMMQSAAVFKPNAFFGQDHPVGVICLTEVDPGLTGKINRRAGVETNLPYSRPQPSVASATRRWMIFIRLPGALVPASAAIYEFELRPILSKSWRPRSVASIGRFLLPA
jgi:hypothetical protein